MAQIVRNQKQSWIVVNLTTAGLSFRFSFTHHVDSVVIDAVVMMSIGMVTQSLQRRLLAAGAIEWQRAIE